MKKIFMIIFVLLSIFIMNSFSKGHEKIDTITQKDKNRIYNIKVSTF